MFRGSFKALAGFLPYSASLGSPITEIQTCASIKELELFRRNGTLKVFYKDVQADLNNISMAKNVPVRQRTEFDYFIPLSPISIPKANVWIAQNCV